MANNASLQSAKATKNDEFYTQYSDIEAEMNAYVEYNPDVFRNKTILLPCDDPEWSNFTKYFANNFERFGIKKLISTSYSNSTSNKQITIFELNSPLYDKSKHDSHGKLFTLTRDSDGSGNIDTDDVEFSGYLTGDGDFRSEEVIALRNEADIIITNPPFSLFREFVSWITDANKQFIVIGSVNAIKYKEIFQLIKNDQIWLGYGFSGGNSYFTVPDELKNLYEDKSYYDKNTGKVHFRNCTWFTNIDHGKRHEELLLDTMEHNLKYNRKLIKKLTDTYSSLEYPHYDNINAIEVPMTDAIPVDYDGVMCVPITFLDKYNPEQFEILDMLNRYTVLDWFQVNAKVQQAHSHCCNINGTATFSRIAIRRKQT